MQICKNTVGYAIIRAESADKAWIGDRHYFNSARGRAQLEAECPAEIVKAVEAVWGSTPTVTEPSPPVQPVQISDQDMVNAEMMMRITTLETGAK